MYKKITEVTLQIINVSRNVFFLLTIFGEMKRAKHKSKFIKLHTRSEESTWVDDEWVNEWMMWVNLVAEECCKQLVKYDGI